MSRTEEEFYQEEDNTKNLLCQNITVLSEILDFLPGQALIVDKNHHIINKKAGYKSQMPQIGEALMCVNFHSFDGQCGSMPICSNCVLNQTLHKTQNDKTGVKQKPVTLLVTIDGERQYRKFLLTTSCIYLDGDEKYLIYLEDSIDHKIGYKNLKDSYMLVRNVLDSLPFGIHWKNLHSTFLGGNQAFASKMKIKNQDSIFGMRDEDFYAKDAAMENQRMDEIILDTKKILIHDKRTTGSQNGERTITSSLINEKGEKIGIVGATYDISPENQADVITENKYTGHSEALFDQFQIGIWEWNLDTDVISGNPVWQSLIGIEHDSIPFKKYKSNINIKDQPKIISVEKQIHSSKRYKFQHQIKYFHPKEKKERWHQITGIKIIRDNSEKPIKLIGKIEDITILKVKETELDQSNVFHNALLNSMKDSIWSIDQNYKITFLNDTFKANYFLAYGVDLQPGDSCLAALEKSMKSKWEKRYKKALGGSSFKTTDECLYKRLDQKAETIFSPIYNNDQIIGISCISREINRR